MPTSILEYPEYRDPSWGFPIGDLTTDQRHKLRIVGTYTAPLGSFGSLTVGGIQSFNRGNPYGAAENITIEPYVPQALPLRERAGGGAVLLHRAGCVPHRAVVQHRPVGALPVSAAARRETSSCS